MANRSEEPWVQLATRIPKPLHYALKVRCVTTDVSVMDFVAQALEDKLGRESARRRASRARG